MSALVFALVRVGGVVLAAKRSRQLNRGAQPQVETKRRKWTSVALEEVIRINGAVYEEHLQIERHNYGVINRPQGPCDCPACQTIRAILNQFFK